VQRRRSVGHYLTLLAAEPEGSLLGVRVPRNAVGTTGTAQRRSRLGRRPVVGVIAKDVWQEAICSVWSEFCRSGLARTRDLDRGLTWEETRIVVSGMTGGLPVLEPGSADCALTARWAEGTLAIDDDDTHVDVAAAPLEQLRELTSRLDTAHRGLWCCSSWRGEWSIVGAGWEHASRIASGWQASIAAVADGLRTHLDSDPSVADTLCWLVSRFVVPVHERIAYSKLPEFTFRFRWEDGLLRFYDLGTGRFPLAAIRDQPLALLTWDLGLWDETGNDNRPITLTDRGTALINEVLA